MLTWCAVVIFSLLIGQFIWFLIIYLSALEPINEGSYIEMYPDYLEIAMNGRVEEFIQNKIEYRNIRSVVLIEKERVSGLFGILYRIGILPRPRRNEKGFYHALSRPKNIINIKLFHKVPLYHFKDDPAVFTLFPKPSVKPMSIPNTPGMIIARTSGHIEHTSRRSRGNYYVSGPGIGMMIQDEVLVKIRKDEREEFMKMISSIASRNRGPPPFDPGPFDYINGQMMLENL
jgi:hypothetical protein